MTQLDAPILCPLLYSATHGAQSRESAELRRRVGAGTLVRLRRGVFVDRATWEACDARGKHVLAARAVSVSLPPSCVVSHASAAAVLDLPSVSRQLGRVEVIDPRRERAQTSPGVIRRPGLVPDHHRAVVGGVRVTTAERTMIDLLGTADFADAVLCADAVLRAELMPAGHADQRSVRPRLLAARARLEAALGPPSSPGGRAARHALAFASPWSENGGESLVRIALFELGAPEVELQVPFFDEQGFIGRCDFVFVLLGVALEFDGLEKYLDTVLLRGRTTRQVIAEEKEREARLRAHPDISDIVRCEYRDVVDPRRLAAKLERAGVPLDPRRLSTASRAAARRFGGHSVG